MVFRGLVELSGLSTCISHELLYGTDAMLKIVQLLKPQLDLIFSLTLWCYCIQHDSALRPFLARFSDGAWVLRLDWVKLITQAPSENQAAPFRLSLYINAHSWNNCEIDFVNTRKEGLITGILRKLKSRFKED